MGAFTYPRSEPGSAGHMDLVERLSATTAELRKAVEGLSEEALTRRPTEDAWSIKETVGHLCDVAPILHTRLWKMAHQEQPLLDAYDADDLAKQRDAQSQLIQDLVYEFAQQRERTIDLLTELVHWNWARQGRHPQHGRISIRQQVEYWLDHEAEHLAQIHELAQRATPS